MPENASQLVAIVPMRMAWVQQAWDCLSSVIQERQYLAMLVPPKLEKSREYIQFLVENDYPYYVAWLPGENRVVGWCDVHPNALEAFAHCGILGIGVHKDFRSDGIGDLLIQSALRHCHRIRLERVELNVYRSNPNAMGLYLKHGFIVEGVKVRGRKVDGRYDDVIGMVRFNP